MKVFASQPMRGLTSDEINDQLQDTKAWLREYFGTSVEAFNEYITREAPTGLHSGQVGIWYLMESLKIMSGCDAVVMVGEWEKHKGCVLEYKIAQAYGIPVIVKEVPNATT